jgi:hypothetical protein
MDDVGLQLLDHPREPPRRREIHFGARRQRHQFEALRRAPPQLAVRVRDERGPLPDLAQAVHGQQDLILAAAPCPGCIYVEGEHRWTLRFRVSHGSWFRDEHQNLGT